MSLLDVFRPLAGAFLFPPVPAPSLGEPRLTGGQVRALYSVAARLAARTANVSDAEMVADIVIEAALAEALTPIAARLVAPAAEAIAHSVIEAIADGRFPLTGDQHPVADAQTRDAPHTGRRA